MPTVCQDPPPEARAKGLLLCQGLAPVESARARAVAGRCHVLLPDAPARQDDLNKEQLGGVRTVLLDDGRTAIAIFGSKCDRG